MKLGLQVPEGTPLYLCLLDVPRMPLTPDMTKVMMMVELTPEEDLEKRRKKILSNERPKWGTEAFAQIFHRRLDADTDAKAFWWIVSQLLTPGDAVMWGYTISMISWLMDKELVTMTDLVQGSSLFAWGLPDMKSDEVEKSWDAQKILDPDLLEVATLDNWLDNHCFWEYQKELAAEHDLSVIPEVVPQAFNINKKEKDD